MKILIIATDFKPKSGGIAEYTHRIGEKLVEKGEEVKIIAPKRKGWKKFDSHVDYGIKRFDYEGYSNYPYPLGYIYKNFRVLYRETKRFDPDLIISNRVPRAAMATFIVSKLCDIPYCVFTYGKEVNKKFNFLERLYDLFPLKQADKITSCSPYTKKLLVEGFSIKKDKINVLYSVVEKDFIKTKLDETKRISELKSESDIILLSLCRLVKRKGIDKTLLAIKKIKSKMPSFKYVIAGEGPYEKELKSLVDKLNLEKETIFWGYASEKEKHLLYRNSDMFIMPSRELEDGDIEGFGIVFLEANSYSLPVIGGESGGVVDAINNGETGFLVNPYDPDDIAEAILKLAKNPHLRKTLGKNGKKRVEEKFNWDYVVSEFHKEIKEEFG